MRNRTFRAVVVLALMATATACGPKPPWASPVALTRPMQRLVVLLEPEVGQASGSDPLGEGRAAAWTQMATALYRVGFVTVSDGSREPGVLAALSVARRTSGPGQCTWKGELTLREPSGLAIEVIRAEAEEACDDVWQSGAERLANLCTRSRALNQFAARRAAANTSGLKVALADHPEGARVLFLALDASDGVPDRVARVVTQILMARLDDVGGLTVVGYQDVNAVLDAEKQRDLVNCQQVNCFAEIGGALGTDFVLYGELGKLGAQLNISLTLVDTRKALVRARVAVQVGGDEDRMPSELPVVVHELIARLNQQPR